MPLSGFRKLNERLVAEGKKPTPNPRNAAAGSVRQKNPAVTRGMPLSIWVYGTGGREGVDFESHSAGAAVAPRARLPHEPLRGALRVDRGRGRGMPRLGAPACGARLRDRRHRDQGRLDRAAARARLAAPATALRAGVQVGADDGDDAAEQDHDPRRPHRRAQPVGGARARRGRRRHGLARDAAQRGRHQPQGHPRGRRRDRAARGRRDPADRRAGRQAPSRARSRSRCRRSARSAARTSSSRRARRCTAARTRRASRAAWRR